MGEWLEGAWRDVASSRLAEEVDAWREEYAAMMVAERFWKA